MEPVVDWDTMGYLCPREADTHMAWVGHEPFSEKRFRSDVFFGDVD